jgi:hypothetical protein
MLFQERVVPTKLDIYVLFQAYVYHPVHFTISIHIIFILCLYNYLYYVDQGEKYNIYLIKFVSDLRQVGGFRHQ